MRSNEALRPRHRGLGLREEHRDVRAERVTSASHLRGEGGRISTDDSALSAVSLALSVSSSFVARTSSAWSPTISATATMRINTAIVIRRPEHAVPGDALVNRAVSRYGARLRTGMPTKPANVKSEKKK